MAFTYVCVRVRVCVFSHETFLEALLNSTVMNLTLSQCSTRHTHDKQHNGEIVFVVCY